MFNFQKKHNPKTTYKKGNEPLGFKISENGKYGLYKNVIYKSCYIQIGTYYGQGDYQDCHRTGWASMNYCLGCSKMESCWGFVIE